MFKANRGGKILKPVLTGVAAFIILAAGALYYFLRGTGSMMAGSAAKQTIAWLGGMRAAVQVYYGDTEGRSFPESLDVLVRNGKYLTEIPEARIYAKTPRGHFTRVHRGQEKQLKNFHSTAEADDTGGWGYVSDPANKNEYGMVFINCTHEYMGGGGDTGVPWSSL